MEKYKNRYKKGRKPWNKGKKNWMSEESKQRMIEKKKGKTPWNKGTKNPEIQGKKNYFFGKYFRGKDNPTWKGGREIYLKKQARLRDNFTCQICGLRDEEIMQVDHIKPKVIFPELKFEMNNLLTLCPNCHARKTIREKKQGYKKEFFNPDNIYQTPT